MANNNLALLAVMEALDTYQHGPITLSRAELIVATVRPVIEAPLLAEASQALDAVNDIWRLAINAAADVIAAMTRQLDGDMWTAGFNDGVESAAEALREFTLPKAAA